MNPPRLTSLLFVIAAPFVTVPAHAQMLGAEVTARRHTTAGELTGCAIEFNLIVRDQVYRGGRPSGLSGSLNWFLRKDRDGLMVSYKLTGGDWEDESLKGTPVRFDISAAWLRASGKLLNFRGRFECEDEKGFCAGDNEDLAVDALIASMGEMELGYIRKEGGLDVAVMLPPLPPQSLDEHTDCTLEITETVRSKLAK